MHERWSDGDADADAIGPSAFPGPAPAIVFLHIPKTGGTALRACFDADAALTGRRRFELLTHRETIADVAAG